MLSRTSSKVGSAFRTPTTNGRSPPVGVICMRCIEGKNQERRNVPAAFVELNDKGTRAHVHFRYDKAAVAGIKTVPGARFVPRDKGGPLWALPLDLISMRRLREVFGNELQL